MPEDRGPRGRQSRPPNGVGSTEPPVGSTNTADELLEMGAAALSGRRPRALSRKLGTPRELPFSKQFSPRQVGSLRDFLGVIDANAGSAEEAQRILHAQLRPGVSKETATYNAILSANHYGLVNESLDGLTDFGSALLRLPSDEERVRTLARHILVNLNGTELVLGLRSLAVAGTRPKKDALARFFMERGLASNADGTDINAVADWLRAAGVLERGGWYRVDDAAFAEVAGIDLGVAQRLAGVSTANQAILEQLALQPGHESDSGEMQRLLAGRPDVQIDAPAFAAKHLDPLVSAGLIEKVTPSAGQRGRVTRFRGTALFETEIVRRLVERFRRQGIGISGPELERPFTELVEELRNGASTDIRGRALELFALRLLHRLGLQNIVFRSRPRNAEEIDGTAEGLAPVHTRWQVQCKNSRSLDADHVAREVGVAVRNRSTVVLLVTTGRLTDPARDFVRGILEGSAYTILGLEGPDVDALAGDEGALWPLLEREARRAQAIRSGTLDTLVAGSDPDLTDAEGAAPSAGTSEY